MPTVEAATSTPAEPVVPAKEPIEPETSTTLVPAAPAPAATATAAPVPEPGDFVRVIVTKAGTVRAALAMVTSVGSQGIVTGGAGDNGEPLISVVYYDGPKKMLGSAAWYQAFHRAGPVFHSTAPAAQSGIVWTDLIKAADMAGAISLPAVVLPDNTAAATAEVQRKEAMGVGRGPVKDPQVEQLAGTATSVADANRNESGLIHEVPHSVGHVGTPMPAGEAPGSEAAKAVQAHPIGSVPATPPPAKPVEVEAATATKAAVIPGTPAGEQPAPAAHEAAAHTVDERWHLGGQLRGQSAPPAEGTTEKTS